MVVPPDRHLQGEYGTLKLTYGPKENYSRSAIAPLSRSAAMTFCQNAIGVLLTGNLDGPINNQGLRRNRPRSGPLEAKSPGIPLSAPQYANVDFCLPVNDISAKLIGPGGQGEGKVTHDVPEPVSQRFS
ncbi:chemotaxis protein CheB [Pseudomonas sp. LTJR-52]|uniref:chemotaxis protein CheB n=1 Tax=Pseudomonas sp. LTJR-52 TaxID=2479392 RepID=UPI0013CE4F2A|nr:chemotaxis protein CheB [Pseudomonas sp. LTJR-52]